jgi:hypothetical protein
MAAIDTDCQAGSSAVARAFVSGNSQARARNNQAGQWGANRLVGIRRVGEQKKFDEC